MNRRLNQERLDHNNFDVGVRGEWRKFNPQNPYADSTDKPEQDLKVESLDDLFDDIDDKKENINKQEQNNINDENILPGWSNRLEFSITNISEELNAVGRYTLIMNVEKNELDSNNFVYNIVGTSTLDGVELEEAQYTNIVVNRPSFEPVPTISTTLGNGVINTGVKHNYVLTFKFNENGENQDEFQGKTFKANVVAKGE